MIFKFDLKRSLKTSVIFTAIMFIILVLGLIAYKCAFYKQDNFLSFINNLPSFVIKGLGIKTDGNYSFYDFYAILVNFILIIAALFASFIGFFCILKDKKDDADAFYYEKTHLYLTKNYIINFQGRFKVIEYRDVIWMYAMNYRTNGIKTSQSINIMDVKGKVTSIATINIVTKERKEVYDEIWNTIASKNTNILLGYTKENAETAKTMKEN